MAGEGNDSLSGGDDTDVLLGEDGEDSLEGGNALDSLHGGKDNDKFIVTSVDQSTPDAPDTILDFKPGKDRIDLSGIDARPDEKGDQAFTFIGERPFNGREGQLRYDFSKGNTVVEGDADGDGTADLEIILAGKIALTADDFVL